MIVPLRRRFSAGGGPYTFINAEAEAFVLRMATEPDNTRKEVIDTAFTTIKTASLGIHSKAALQVYAAHEQSTALLNWFGNYSNATIGVQPTFTVDEGFGFNGSTEYLNSGMTQFANTPSAGNVQAMVFLKTATTGSGKIYFGSSGPGYITRFQHDGATLTWALNSAGGSIGIADTYLDKTSYIIQRLVDDCTLFENGVSLSGPTAKNRDQDQLDLDLFVGANGPAPGGLFANCEIYAVYHGRLLDPDKLHSAISTYLTAVTASYP